jgi:hypothetical protein
LSRPHRERFRFGDGGELVGFDARALEHDDEEVGERVIVGRVVGQVLTVAVLLNLFQPPEQNCQRCELAVF